MVRSPFPFPLTIQTKETAMRIEQALARLDKDIAEYPEFGLLPPNKKQRDRIVQLANRHEHGNASVLVGTDSVGIGGCPVGFALVCFEVWEGPRFGNRPASYGVDIDGNVHS